MEFLSCSRDLAVRGYIFAVFLGLWSRQISAQISVVPIPKTPAVGENVLFSVSGVTGNIIFFSWYRGESTERNQMLSYAPGSSSETTFSPYEGRVRGFPNGSMEISGVTTNDSGNYTVQIQAPGLQVARVTITVYEILGKPSITASLVHPMEPKDSVTLTCVTSSAVQTILWYKDNQRLPSDNRMSLSDNNRSVTISNVSSADSGNYQCEVINPVSCIKSDSYTLTVYSSGNNDLPPGAIAGIVIGILVVIALIAALIYLFLLKGNKSNSSELSMKETNSNPRSDHNLRSSGRNPATQTGEEVNYSEVNFKPGAPKPMQPRNKENSTEYAEIRRT